MTQSSKCPVMQLPLHINNQFYLLFINPFSELYRQTHISPFDTNVSASPQYLATSFTFMLNAYILTNTFSKFLWSEFSEWQLSLLVFFETRSLYVSLAILARTHCFCPPPLCTLPPTPALRLKACSVKSYLYKLLRNRSKISH